MMKCATAYLRKNIIYLNSSSKTKVGAWIGTPPFLKVNNTESSNGISEQVIDALNGSKQQVDHPKEFGSLFKPVLELAGVKSYSTFVRNTHCCELCEEDGVITITPTVNRGNEGFDHLNDQSVKVSLHRSKDIATGLIEAFDKCK